MQVIISVGGIFHAPTLGVELNRRGVLEAFYTTYPRFKLKSYDLPRDLVVPIRHPELLFQLGDAGFIEYVLPERARQWLKMQKNVRFDRAVAKRLSPLDEGIFVGFLSKSLQSIRRANDLGYTTIVESSICHVREQVDILGTEYETYGQIFEEASSDQIARREAEYEAADYISVPSTYAAQTFLERGFSEDDLLQIPLGVNMERHANDPADAVDGTEDTVRFLYAGTVDLQKGIQYLLPAWDSLDLPNAELLVAGHVSANAREIVAEYQDHDNIRFLGWVDDMAQLYASASAFVLPSLQDGFGMVVPEAMGNGLPVVVTENTGAKDCVREGTDGFVVPTRDPVALAEALEYLYDNADERHQMGSNAHQQAWSAYSAEAYGEVAYETYESLV